MKKNKLLVNYEFNFDLIALNATVKEYKLAWSINKFLHLNLVKGENLALDFVKNQLMYVSNYVCETDYRLIRLLKNRSEVSEGQFGPFLIPEMKNFDYFLIIEDETDSFEINPFISRIKEIPFVQFAMVVDVATLKSKDNLLF